MSLKNPEQVRGLECCGELLRGQGVSAPLPEPFHTPGWDNLQLISEQRKWSTCPNSTKLIFCKDYYTLIEVFFSDASSTPSMVMYNTKKNLNLTSI